MPPSIVRPASKFDSRFRLVISFFAILCSAACGALAQTPTQLPNGRLLGEVPGHPRTINNLATAAAVSPDGRFVVFLHSGYGAYSEDSKHSYQSLSVLNVATDALADFPETRLDHGAHQTYFLGLAFSLDGKHLYASMAS